ncbi:SAM-dependent methyltransferase [Dactylosporangium sp. NPDC051541]|uniref:SAM-dependent methyltransferase n=1 Tax=Dactylosporangium sp. NPDC051541 TaxID=3363977 RepID=UPI00379F8767
MTSSTAAHADLVRRYYDQNTAAFDRLGQGGASIHRAVWAPGVRTRPESFHYVDELILAALPLHSTQPSQQPAATGQLPTVVDLGCGLGASLTYLAGNAPIRGEGLTISPKQAEGATRLLNEAGLGDRVRVREGNYLDVPADLHGTADVAFSIEAFLHSPDASGYFREAARVLRPGGRLMVCDDFLTPAAPDAPPARARRLAEFRDGWRVGSLLTVAQVQAVAAEHGLEMIQQIDLTPYLELRRPRDRFIAALVAAGRPLRLSGEYWKMLAGGDALQWCLLNGLLNYRVLAFRAGAR